MIETLEEGQRSKWATESEWIAKAPALLPQGLRRMLSRQGGL